jgi:hypothetical protein
MMSDGRQTMERQTERRTDQRLDELVVCVCGGGVHRVDDDWVTDALRAVGEVPCAAEWKENGSLLI